MTYETIRQQAYEANMKIPENHLALYTWGNVSAFDKDKGVFAIKPSGVPYPDLTPESMVIIDLVTSTSVSSVVCVLVTVYPPFFISSNRLQMEATPSGELFSLLERPFFGTSRKFR